jgi:threonylcarbamoyladenosine tRNA methylthiotransferase CDKAL1
MWQIPSAALILFEIFDSDKIKMSGAQIYIETYGCSLNVADSEVMAGMLHAAGYEITNSLAEADAVILNSCTVKDKTFRNFVQRLRQLEALAESSPRPQPRPKIIIAGCIPKPYASTPLLQNHSYLGVDAMGDIAAAMERVLRGETVQRLDGAPLQRLNVPRRRVSSVIEIVPIAQGCVGNCAYCQTRVARGALHSYSTEQILAHVRCAYHEGAREFWITAQDTGAYGLDIGTNIVELLRKLIALPGDFQIRLGMGNPNFVLQHIGGLVNVFQSPKLFQFLHVPLQSGSDRILRAMNRDYSVDDFLRVCRTFSDTFERFSIATDVICGFPGETNEDFECTVRVLETIKPAVVNRSRFSPRPFTPAAEMKPLPQHVIADRSRRLARLVERISYESNETWIGWSGTALIDQQKKAHNLLGRNCAYKPIVIDLQSAPRSPEPDSKVELKLGKRVNVRVVEAKTFHLMARPLNKG